MLVTCHTAQALASGSALWSVVGGGGFEPQKTQFLKCTAPCPHDQKLCRYNARYFFLAVVPFAVGDNAGTLSVLR